MEMTCNTRCHVRRKDVPGKVKYKVCYHRRVLFVTENKLLPRIWAFSKPTATVTSSHLDQLALPRRSIRVSEIAVNESLI